MPRSGLLVDTVRILVQGEMIIFDVNTEARHARTRGIVDLR